MLDQLTNAFFQRHWQTSFGPTPMWNEPWSTTGQGPIPCHDMQGCYSLYQGEQLVYVGLGASRGAGLYVGHGIGKRLYSHVLRVDAARGVQNNKGFYCPREKWAHVTHLRTIGLPAGYGYLAPALELFLLNRLAPDGKLQNIQRPGGVTGTSSSLLGGA